MRRDLTKVFLTSAPILRWLQSRSIVLYNVTWLSYTEHLFQTMLDLPAFDLAFIHNDLAPQRLLTSPYPNDKINFIGMVAEQWVR